jgi:hypothetical protein
MQHYAKLSKLQTCSYLRSKSHPNLDVQHPKCSFLSSNRSRQNPEYLLDPLPGLSAGELLQSDGKIKIEIGCDNGVCMPYSEGFLLAGGQARRQ